jgi:monoterpene epsilon-lactone hydrolase
MPSAAHQELVQLILNNPSADDAPIADRRAAFDQLLLSFPIEPDVRAASFDAGGVPLDWVVAGDEPGDRVVLMIHGGGGCMGSARTYREFASRLSRDTGARVAVVDYRLAPEAPFPAGVEDGCTAYASLLEQGIPASRIVVVGDSGGVGLALAVVGRARDEGLAAPAGVIGFAPWIDLEVGPTIAEAADVGDPMITRASLQQFAAWYLGDHRASDPLANALHRDWRGMPPLLLLAGTRDVGYRDALRLAELARASGVDATVQTLHGLIHNWQMFPHLPEAAAAISAATEFFDTQVPNDTRRTKESV